MLNDLFELSVALRHNYCGVRRGARKDSPSGGALASGRASPRGGARARPVEVEDSGDDGEGEGEEDVDM